MGRKRKLTPLPPLRHNILAKEVARCHWDILDPHSEALLGTVHKRYGKFEAVTDDQIVATPRCFNAAVEAILARRRALKLPA